MALKIPLLLVQYLYKNRKMSLPGLGIFTLDKSVVLPEENDRVLLSMPNAVQFQNANIASADKELITYICENTGKIKPLAISDLDSYLNLGTEMLNIGKPFHLEGIGTITKNKLGKFDFAPGEYTLIKEGSSSHAQEKKKAHANENNPMAPRSPVPNRVGLKLLVVLAALAVVGWGGWEMYKKSSASPAESIIETPSPVATQTSVASDSASRDSVRVDTAAHVPAVIPAPTSAPGASAITYKFVILTTPTKERALKRYNQLLGFDLKVHLYQKDSTLYKVYFQFPALARDTVHIKDSLRREYAHEIRIEP